MCVCVCVCVCVWCMWMHVYFIASSMFTCKVTVTYYPCRLGAVMKTAEDIEIDVPKIWDYIGELLCPPVANRTLPLGTLISTTFPSNLLASGKAALLTTKLLRQCVVVTSEEVVFQLWSSCKEQHDCLQLRPEDLEVRGDGGVGTV